MTRAHATRAPQTGATPAIDERQRTILAELAREDEATVAFQGLKRRLELHQQKLTRSLDRLVDHGLVASTEHGYRLTDAGWERLAGRQTNGPRCRDRPIAQMLLPPDLEVEAVAEALAERWFKGLRWYGRADGPGETTLIWLTEGAHDIVRLRLAGSTATVTTDCCQELEVSTYAALHPILSAVTELYPGDSQAA